MEEQIDDYCDNRWDHANEHFEIGDRRYDLRDNYVKQGYIKWNYDLELGECIPTIVDVCAEQRSKNSIRGGDGLYPDEARTYAFYYLALKHGPPKYRKLTAAEHEDALRYQDAILQYREQIKTNPKPKLKLNHNHDEGKI